ncbi:hypothetical protein MC885_006900 [Smutsia gigantea]|nr:hypothetical protein MC885_006900 [Smutsia gigantea]
MGQMVGRFLGEVDGALLTQLLRMGVFSQVTMYDYQAMCKPPNHHHSAARPLVNPVSALLTTARWLANELLLLLLEWSAWGAWRGDSGAQAHKHKKQEVLQPCDTEYPVFVHQTTIQEANGIISCGACQKMFVMQQIPHSNLLLLVTDSTCDCSVFPQENAQDCGGTSHTSVSLLSLLLPFCAWALSPSCCGDTSPV